MVSRYSRRRFLQLTGGAALSASLAGLLAACGGESEPTPTRAAGGAASTSTSTGTGTTGTSASPAASPGASPAASPRTTTGTPTVIGTPQAGVLPELTSVPDALKGSGEVRVVSFGGQLQEAQRKAYFEPFTRLTGIKVVEDEGPDSAKVKAMVDTKNVIWDVALLSRTSAKLLEKQGDYWEPIDYGLVDTANIDEIFRYKYSLDMLPFAHIIAYRTDILKEGPKNWKDVWDAKTFPGPRAFSTGGTASSIPPLVGALIADGVAPGQVYPIDIDRAFKSLDKIKSEVVKWWDTEAQPVQMLTDKEAVIVQASNGRVAQLKAQNVPVEIVWDGGNLLNNAWVVPKGAKNATNAMKFIAFTTLAVSQARLSMLIPYGFTNKKAAEYLPQEILTQLPTAPGTQEKLVPYDYDWWVENRPKVIDRWNEWVLG